tara:strand:- start:100 stop:558 length:459 start_codon:yes stop_codon:yes gene_type:complete
MGVPNTTTFSLQDVVDEINPTTDDLVDSFADAVANKFDSSYSGSKDELLNFRNYGAGKTTRISNIAFVSITSMLNLDITIVNQSGSNPLTYRIQFSSNEGTSWVTVSEINTFTGTTFTRTDPESVPFNNNPRWFRVYDQTNLEYSDIYEYSN